MASLRESRYIIVEVLSFLSEDKFASSNKSSDEETDFMEHVVTLAVSDSNLGEESTSTHEFANTEPYGATDVQFSA